MENIVTLAIVGTQQAGEQEIVTGLPVDALSDQLSGDKERKLLLAAGAWSIYRQAGRIAETMAEAPEPAQPERLKPCSREHGFRRSGCAGSGASAIVSAILPAWR